VVEKIPVNGLGEKGEPRFAKRDLYKRIGEHESELAAFKGQGEPSEEGAGVLVERGGASGIGNRRAGRKGKERTAPQPEKK